MITETLTGLFDRDILLVKKEIGLFRNEAAIWRIEKSIANSAGNLCLHLVGNLKFMIGNQLGGEPSVRQRDLEFSTKGTPREELLRMLEETRLVVQRAMSTVREESLSQPFPLKIWEEQTDIGYTLIRLAAHLNYHLGQINYHRRLIDDQL